MFGGSANHQTSARCKRKRWRRIRNNGDDHAEHDHNDQNDDDDSVNGPTYPQTRLNFNTNLPAVRLGQYSPGVLDARSVFYTVPLHPSSWTVASSVSASVRIGVMLPRRGGWRPPPPSTKKPYPPTPVTLTYTKWCCDFIFLDNFDSFGLLYHLARKITYIYIYLYLSNRKTNYLLLRRPSLFVLCVSPCDVGVLVVLVVVCCGRPRCCCYCFCGCGCFDSP